MITFKIVYLASLVQLVFIFNLFAQDINSKTDLIIKGIEYGDKAIVSGQGSYNYEFQLIDLSYVNVVFNKQKINVIFAFKDNKIYYEGTIYSEKFNVATPFISKNIKAFNGEKTDFLSYVPDLKTKLIKPMGMIESNNTIEYIKDPRCYGINYYNNKLSDLFKLKKYQINNYKIQLDELLYIGNKNYENIDCEVFKGFKKATSDSIIIFIAPNKMYRPVLICDYHLNGLTEIITYYKEYNNGLWFPKHIIANFYKINGDEKKQINKITITINDDFEVNSIIDNNIFNIQYPKGLKVYDRRINKYIINE